jgi:hypothetical protein
VGTEAGVHACGEAGTASGVASRNFAIVGGYAGLVWPSIIAGSCWLMVAVAESHIQLHRHSCPQGGVAAERDEGLVISRGSVWR